MSSSSGSVGFLYDTVLGRLILKVIMALRLDRPVVRFLRSRASKPVVPWYVKRCGIPLSSEEIAKFPTFRDFFCRTRDDLTFDSAPERMISPCDGFLSAFPIEADVAFAVKGSRYRVEDLIQDASLAREFQGGDCLIFRLCASDYHHYCYIDDGEQGENHAIPGKLHSVQPIVCEKVPVFTLNRRSWCLLKTEHFGDVAQCEIAALIVGGIFNDKKSGRFSKGEEKGHFEPFGSTIILLFQPERVALRPDLREALERSDEVRVNYGEWVATATYADAFLTKRS